MINANELRIGNWYIGGTGKHYQYTTEDLFDCNIEHDISVLSPIPLTLEILKKCGFRNDHGEGSRIWKLNDVEIFHYEIDKSFSFYFKGKEKILEHLHQLQNLYFALTGKEIEYATE